MCEQALENIHMCNLPLDICKPIQVFNGTCVLAATHSLLKIYCPFHQVAMQQQGKNGHSSDFVGDILAYKDGFTEIFDVKHQENFLIWHLLCHFNDYGLTQVFCTHMHECRHYIHMCNCTTDLVSGSFRLQIDVQCGFVLMYVTIEFELDLCTLGMNVCTA